MRGRLMELSSRLLLLRAKTRMCPPQGVARGRTELHRHRRPLFLAKLRLLRRLSQAKPRHHLLRFRVKSPLYRRLSPAKLHHRHLQCQVKNLLHRPLCLGKLHRRRLQSRARPPLRHQDSLAKPLPLRFQARLLPLPRPNRDPERAMAASSAPVARAGTELSGMMNVMMNQDFYDVMILGFSTILVMVMFPFIRIGVNGLSV